MIIDLCGRMKSIRSKICRWVAGKCQEPNICRFHERRISIPCRNTRTHTQTQYDEPLTNTIPDAFLIRRIDVNIHVLRTETEIVQINLADATIDVMEKLVGCTETVEPSINSV